MNVRALILFVALLAYQPGRASAANDNYNIGSGIYDITGAVAESSMFGYANNADTTGLQQRLRSRAFVIQSRVNGRRVVFVSADLGAMHQSIRQEVVRRLQSRYGSAVYNYANVMLTATHTHVGTGGLAHYPLYVIAAGDKVGYGYSAQNYEAVVNGIFQSIVLAHSNLTPGSIEFVEGDLTTATKNRSQTAYWANADDHLYPYAFNPKMTMLKFRSSTGQEIGMLNWFAIHNTSLSSRYTKISGDNKGYAQHLFEKLKGTNYLSSRTFVAAFANADEGDVVPIDGNAYSATGFQGSSDEILNAERSGRRQYDRAVSLYGQAGTFFDGALDYRHRWANFESYTVSGTYTGVGARTLCNASRGISFAAGGENGPSNIPGIYEGMTRSSFSVTDQINNVDTSPLGSTVRFLFGTITWGIQDNCQGEKYNLLTTGALNWVPEVLPFQLFVIGDFAIIGAPVEVTTASGRRIRQTVLDELAPAGVGKVVIAGLANEYSGYLATYEEFQKQHYEGASTEFGPYTLAAYQQEFGRLAIAIRTGAGVIDDKQPPNRAGDLRLQRPGVVFDGKFLTESFGQVLVDAASSYYRGSTVNVRFRGGHPKNNLKTQGSYLVVQRWTGSAWADYAYDWDWNTEYAWSRDGIDRTFVDITWRIPSDAPTGTYRIRQDGHWKNGWDGSINAYTGYSRAFTVL